MNIRLRIHLPVLALLLSCGSLWAQQAAAYKNPLRTSRQLIVVRTASWESMAGSLQYYERASEADSWKPASEQLAMTLGAKGLAWGRGLHGEALGQGPVKTEGDMKSPAGVFELGAVFGLASQASGGRFAMPYIALDSTVECVDDPVSVYYNLVVDGSNVSARDWKSSEHMWRVGADYAWGVVVRHNSDPRLPGHGSCIFIHVWGGPTKPTEGCTSLDEGRLVGLLEWLRPGARPVLVQLPEGEYLRLKTVWNLP